MSSVVSATATPAFWKASTLLLAVPLLPETIAPALAHPLALGRCPSRDEGHGLQPASSGQQLGRALLVAASDLTDQHQVRGRRILLEELDNVLEGEAQNRVATDANYRRIDRDPPLSGQMPPRR